MPVGFPPFPLLTQGSVVFVGAGGAPTQDNTNFFWNAITHQLKIGDASVAYSSINIQNSKANVFITGGNSTLSGDTNVGIGSNALQSLTTGQYNICIGSSAGLNINSGASNFCLGINSGVTLTSGGGNLCFGPNAFANGNGDFNIAIGLGSMGSASASGYCIGIGLSAANSLINDTHVIALGFESLYTQSASSFGQIAIGYKALHTIDSATGSNTAIGPSAGFNITAGDYNTLLGGWQGPSSSISNVIALSDGAGTLKLDFHYSNASTWTFTAALMVTPVAVASLPAAGISGRRHFVTNATATTFASIVAGGGANPVPVYDDGTNWRIG